MRGGGPAVHLDGDDPDQSSPHARGWSRHQAMREIHTGVFPACAGVVPKPVPHPRRIRGLPRMRGGGPASTVKSRVVV